MKKIFLFLSIAAMLTSCSDEKASPTTQSRDLVLKNGNVLTPSFTLDNNTYDLEYVKEHAYNDDHFCYAHLNLNGNQFANLAREFTTDYDFSKVFEIRFFGEDKEICKGDGISKDNINSMLVYYVNGNNEAFMDFIKLSDGSKESYQIADAFATISMYFLMEKSNIKNNPSIVGVKNADFDLSNIIFDDEKDMISYSVVPPRQDHYLSPEIGNGTGPDCPLSCTNGPADECNALSNCAGICGINHTVTQLYLTNSYKNLSLDLFAKYDNFYAFRDFLNTSQKGRDYIIKYYALGRLIGTEKVNLSLSTMIKCANVAISNADKLKKLIDSSNYASDVLFDKTEGDTYRDLLTDMKSASTKTRWNNIIDGLISDVDTYEGKTVGDIIKTFK